MEEILAIEIQKKDSFLSRRNVISQRNDISILKLQNGLKENFFFEFTSFCSERFAVLSP